MDSWLFVTSILLFSVPVLFMNNLHDWLCQLNCQNLWKVVKLLSLTAPRFLDKASSFCILHAWKLTLFFGGKGLGETNVGPASKKKRCSPDWWLPNCTGSTNLFGDLKHLVKLSRVPSFLWSLKINTEVGGSLKKNVYRVFLEPVKCWLIYVLHR